MKTEQAPPLKVALTEGLGVTFTPEEIKALEGHPDALRSLANWHDVKATESEAIGPEFAGSVRFHEARREALEVEANRIEAEY